jgi:peptidoglycan hydrolase CwlO-like protein
LRGAPIPGKEQKSSSRSVSEQADIDQALAKLSADRERLEARMTLLARENKRLKDLSAGSSSSLNKGDAHLREQMNEMAAEVVNLVAKLDGPGSPISKALADTEATEGDGAAKKLSLADRVRALQKAAASGD